MELLRIFVAERSGQRRTLCVISEQRKKNGQQANDFFFSALELNILPTLQGGKKEN